MKRYKIFVKAELVGEYKTYDEAIRDFIRLAKEHGNRPVDLWDYRTNKLLNVAE